MPHTVYMDRGTHYEVIADYSGSKRHAALTDAQWNAEYSSSADYATMRNSQAGSIANITPKGCGKWLKDWSGPFTG